MGTKYRLHLFNAIQAAEEIKKTELSVLEHIESEERKKKFFYVVCAPTARVLLALKLI
jgi:hypothetical protein